MRWNFLCCRDSTETFKFLLCLARTQESRDTGTGRVQFVTVSLGVSSMPGIAGEKPSIKTPKIRSHGYACRFSLFKISVFNPRTFFGKPIHVGAAEWKWGRFGSSTDQPRQIPNGLIPRHPQGKRVDRERSSNRWSSLNRRSAASIILGSSGHNHLSIRRYMNA